MRKNIKKILAELYEIDSSLKDKEKELEIFIDKMLELKPNIKIDAKFKENLRKRIYDEIEAKNKDILKSSNKFNFSNFFAYIFSFVWLAIFWIFFYTFIVWNFDFSKNNEEKKIIAFWNSIKEIKWWFWDLSNLSKAKISNWFENISASSDTSSIKNKDNVPIAKIWENTLEQRQLDHTMPLLLDEVPIFEVYRYNFTWDLNLDLKDFLPIYKQEFDNKTNSFLIDSIKKLSFNGLSFDKFKNLNISNISLNEDKNYWYIFNINTSNNSLEISKNYSKWPDFDYNTESKNIILDENEIFSIVRDFIKKYNIDLSNYWKAIIEKTYLEVLNSFKTKNIFPDYLNQSVNVIYPLIIDQKEIYDDTWKKTGVFFEIDLKEKKVSRVYWIESHNYLKSDYQVETNKDNILRKAKEWWMNWLHENYDSPDNIKYIDLNLKNPKIVYISYYKYIKIWFSEKYLLPAIIFEIDKNNLWDWFYKDNIIVPLPKDFYKYKNQKL